MAQRMVQDANPRLAIVGAGASGVLLANALARPGVTFDVTLVDPRPGRGAAYGGADERHLLNTRAGNMSLDAASPEGFLDWLNTYHPRSPAWDEGAFAPRRLYGDYLERRLRDLANRTPGLGTTRVIRAKALAAEQLEDGWALRLSNGERLAADVLVLATGVARPRALLFHGRETIEAFVQDDPWDDQALKGATAGDVLLVGSGLTAVDVAAALWRRSRNTKVVAVSRHAMLPRVHASPEPGAPALTPPYPTTARELYAKLRAAAGFVEGDQSLRHGVFLNLREIAAQLWQRLPHDERAMFLRHFRAYWEVERHRIPPAAAEIIQKAIRGKRLEVVRGRLAEAKATADGAAARVALITQAGPRALTVSRIINCTGPEPDPFRSRNPLLLDLLAQGVAAADPLGLGLHVDEDSRVLDARGTPAKRLFALGALTQGQFFEITALAEIRVQAVRVAGTIAAEVASREIFNGRALLRPFRPPLQAQPHRRV